MAFTYTGHPESNPLDYGRFIIGDTQEAGHILEDAEVEFLLSQYTHDGVLDTLQFRAAIFRQAATMYAIKAQKRTLGPQSEDTSARLKYFQDEADKAEKQLTFSGTPPLPTYQYRKVFTKHMMANRDALCSKV